MAGTNPLFAVGLGVLLIAISVFVPGFTRDLILRVAGAIAILAGAALWVARRRS